MSLIRSNIYRIFKGRCLVRAYVLRNFLKNVRFGTVWYLVRQQFERITVGTYPNKPLDSMDFNSKVALNSWYAYFIFNN